MKDFNYQYDEVLGYSRPTLYPGEKQDNVRLPENVTPHYTQLNSVIENKYSMEYLKICAFYNKLFPSLKFSDWSRSSYNTRAFTAMDQERTDTGTGISCNYLKQIVDQIVSRLGTLTFLPHLSSESPSLDYIIYRDACERLIKKQLKDSGFVSTCLGVFHDAAILGYSHVFVDPVTESLVKASDFEIGVYEPEMNKGTVKRMLYRDYAFPVTSLGPYIEGRDDIKDRVKNRQSVDFKMLVDCCEHCFWVVIDNDVLEPQPYPWDEVLVKTFAWDLGVAKCLTTSLFDLLYPLQREINKMNAKLQQLIRMYKGPTPVFSNDVDLAVKQISNGSGEALYVDSSRPMDTLMSVINPTPLDSAMSAEIESHKTRMYELAGIQQMNFEMENMRSAAAVIALDQTRDSVYQAQLQAYSQFIEDCMRMWVECRAMFDEDMKCVQHLLEECSIELKPVHLNDPLSDEKAITDSQPDYLQLQTAKLSKEIILGEVTYGTLPYWCIKEQVVLIVAEMLVRMDAVGVEVPMTVHLFLVDAFIDDVSEGKTRL